ncbi:ParA family protein [Vibrio crassostreae]|nr:ParA family protein [Vibrio chagasii]CAK2878915.1 ParA family protein [Vibrio crassostreae]
MTFKKKPISLVCYNQKGGVGKSFCSSWLAYLMATGGIDGTKEKKRVVLVDLDSQQNVSKTFLPMQKRSGLPYALPPKHPEFVEGDPDNGTWNGYSTSSDILFDRQFAYYPVEGVENLKILPSEGRVDRLNEVMHQDGFIPLISQLAELFLETEAELGEVDIFIFDTPPSKTSICEGFLAKCSHVLVPTQLEFDSVESVPLLMENIRIYNETRDEPIKIAGIIPNLVRSSSMTNTELEQYTKLVSDVYEYQKTMNIDYDVLPEDFFLVNRVIFKPRHKPDDLSTVFNLKKDPKATKEMSDLYDFVLSRLEMTS